MQLNQIINITEKAMTQLDNEHNDLLLKAREEFCNFFGKIDIENDNYENQTYLFHYWTIFNFKCDDFNLNQWFLDLLVPTMRESFEKIEYSIFDFMGDSFFKKNHIKNLINGNKIELISDKKEPFLCKNDLFIGRIVPWENKYMLLPGLILLPKEIAGDIQKKGKQISKKNKNSNQLVSVEKDEFLYDMSVKASRWNRYNRSNYQKIFEFN